MPHDGHADQNDGVNKIWSKSHSARLLGKEPRQGKSFRFGKICGLKIGQSGLSLTHLIFADEFFIFGQATQNEVREIKETLSSFCHWSGQERNFGKSSIIFRTNLNLRAVIMNILGVQEMGPDEKSLGPVKAISTNLLALRR